MIAITDQMEIDVEPVKVAAIAAHVTTTSAAAEPPRDDGLDLQQPELLSSEALVRVLSERSVPVPVYPDGRPSRERLVYLFRRHVTPRPQREGGARAWRGRGKRRRRPDEAMEVEDGSRSASWDEWVRSGGEGGVQGENQPKKRQASLPASVSLREGER